ncbi:MAG: cell wall metabolism sensor histidine kinase WalK, partial [Acidobacteriales bacterium]|nr:cell wall metabolism sensor histidine kinase WalK [Terriglobales bacterium]
MALSGVLLLSLFEQYFLQATENSLAAQARITAQAILPDSNTEGQVNEVQTPLTNTLQQQSASNLYVESANAFQLQASNFQLNPLADVSIQLGTQLNTHIRILNADGIVLVDSQPSGIGQNLQTDTLVRQALHGSYASDLLDSNRMGLALPVERGDELMAIVYLSQPLNDVIAVLQDLRGRWLLATGSGLLLSAVVGLVLSQVIVKPLRRLTAATEAVAAGNYDQKVTINTRDELGRLSKTFNEMTERLRSARQMQTDFVANVSHELRTPLTSMKSMIETLRNGAVDDHEVRDPFLETVETETNRLIRLVNDLLLLSRVDSRGLQLHCKPVEVAPLIQDVVTPFAAHAQNAIQLQIPDGLCVSVDPDRIAQVLINLLDNAAKYSRPQGAVTVTARRDDDDMALISIADEGIGIPSADLSRIGQRFYRT